MALTKDDVKKLCEALPLESGHSVRVNGEAKPDAQKQWALWLVYTEEGPITERLDDVDPNWELEITDKWAESNSATVYARLTVCGVTRDCVGSGSNPNAGDAQKGAATDALKRGARLFGIGRYLLDAPQFYTDWASKTGNNRRTRKQEEQWEKEAFAKFATWYRREFGQSPTQQSPPAPTPPHVAKTPPTQPGAPSSELDDVVWTRDRKRLTKLRDLASEHWQNEDGVPMAYPHVYNRIAILISSDLRPKTLDTFVGMMEHECKLEPKALMDAIEAYEANES